MYGNEKVKCEEFDATGDSSANTRYIPSGASAYGGIRLRGLFIRLSAGGAFDDDRKLSFLDKLTDEPLLEIFVTQESVDPGATGSSGGLNLVIPGLGIRCPNGVKFETHQNIEDYVGVFYSG